MILIINNLWISLFNIIKSKENKITFLLFKRTEGIILGRESPMIRTIPSAFFPNFETFCIFLHIILLIFYYYYYYNNNNNK